MTPITFDPTLLPASVEAYDRFAAGVTKYNRTQSASSHWTVAYVMVGMANAFKRQVRCELNGHKLFASPGMIPLDVRKQYELSSAVAFIARKRVGGG